MKIDVSNPNYAAKIVSISSLRPHPNADKLLITTVDFQNVIVGNHTQEGDLYVFFPLESVVNKEFLALQNLFNDSSLNKDQGVKGFFHKSGRVKAVRLRGIASEGYLHPLSRLNEWLGTEFGRDNIGLTFTSVNDVCVCEKYVPFVQRDHPQTKDKKAKVSKVIDNQFRFHPDTEKLKQNILRISPDDLISITYKLHGTSAVFANVLCKKPLPLKDRIAKFFGVNVVDSHYDLVISSRKVIKNAYADKVSNSFYDVDIWGIVGKELKNKIPQGITLYGEIVGRLPNGKWIQKNYDYGHNGHQFYVYRVTYTSVSGEVYEFSTPQIVEFCEQHGLMHVPLFFYGLARDLFSLDVDSHWHVNFLDALVKRYNEKICYMCFNKVPEEGIVLRQESLNFKAFKLKSFAFLERESKELDEGNGDFDA